MIHLDNINHDDLQTLIEALADTHRMRVVVELMDHNEDPIDSLTFPETRVTDGEIQYDSTADVTRSLSLTVLDPLGKLPFDPNAPAQGALFVGYFVHVKYEVWVDDLGGYVPIPVFWGPLTSYNQAKETVTLEAQGKEVLLLDPHFAVQGYSIKSGTSLKDAIKKVAGKAGETRFDIPDTLDDLQLPGDRVITPKMQPWDVIQGGTRTGHTQQWTATVGPNKGKTSHPHLQGGDLLAVGDVDRHAFYDGRGRLAVRKRQTEPQFTFDEGWITSPPSVTYTLEQFVNYVKVTGTKGKGAKSTPIGVATLLNSHPLSAQSLSRNGDPRWLAAYVDSQQTSDNACQSRAQEILHNRAGTGVEASFDCLPFPMLEEGDHVRVDTGDYDLEFELKQWTLPLSSAAAMTIGGNKRVARKTPHFKPAGPSTRRHRRRQRRHHNRHHHHHGNG